MMSRFVVFFFAFLSLLAGSQIYAGTLHVELRTR